MAWIQRWKRTCDSVGAFRACRAWRGNALAGAGRGEERLQTLLHLHNQDGGLSRDVFGIRSVFAVRSAGVSWISASRRVVSVLLAESIYNS